MSNSEKSLNSANALYDLSTDVDMQQKTGYVDFDGFLWVINASYYSMFYMARAMLENEGVKISAAFSVHSITFDALVNLFYINGKLEKRLVQYFAESLEEASELLGRQKANELIEEYFWEKEKRANFTYNTRETVIKAKAGTSLQRARKFNLEIKKTLV